MTRMYIQLMATFDNDGHHFTNRFYSGTGLRLKLNKILVYIIIKLTKHRLTKLFLFPKHQNRPEICL